MLKVVKRWEHCVAAKSAKRSYTVQRLLSSAGSRVRDCSSKFCTESEGPAAPSVKRGRSLPALVRGRTGKHVPSYLGSAYNTYHSEQVLLGRVEQRLRRLPQV
jgi:hypothetical protein